MSSRIEMFTGRFVDPLNLQVDDIDIRDIAHALSNQCRFTGHTSVFYSVAEHSIRVAELLDQRGCDRITVLTGLLHDATEAYLVDLPRPLKHHPLLGDVFRQVEQQVWSTVAAQFDLPSEMPAVVKQADVVLLVTERRDLLPSGRPGWLPIADEWDWAAEIELLPDRIVPWAPRTSEYRFLELFDRLAGRWEAQAA